MYKTLLFLFFVLVIASCGSDEDSGPVKPLNGNGAIIIDKNAKFFDLDKNYIWYYDVDRKATADTPIERYKAYLKYLAKGKYTYKGNLVDVYQFKLGSVEDSSKYLIGGYCFCMGDSLYSTEERNIEGRIITSVPDISPIYIRNEGLITMDHRDYNAKIIEYDFNGTLYEAWELTYISDRPEYSSLEIIIPGIGFVYSYYENLQDSSYDKQTLYHYESN